MEYILLVLLIANLTLTVFHLLDSRGKRATVELDTKVQEALDAKQRRSRDMDEGFENIMLFSLNGNDGFGGGN